MKSKFDKILRMKNIGTLGALNVELTSVCQVKCIWCLMQTFNKIKKQHMPFDKFCEFIERNAAYLVKNKTKVTPFSRGEALIYPHFWECCRLMREKNILIGSLATNLSVKINITDFIENPIEYLVVNIGGVTKNVHEKCMINSNFDLVVHNLRQLWAAKIHAHIKINPTRFNIHQLKMLPEFVEKLGGKPEYATEYTTCFPHPDDTTEEEKKFFLENVYTPEHKHLFRFISDEDNIIQQEHPDCPQALMVDTVFADGGLSICCHDHHQQSVVADAFTLSLEEIHASDSYIKSYWRGLNRQLPNCRYCA